MLQNKKKMKHYVFKKSSYQTDKYDDESKHYQLKNVL